MSGIEERIERVLDEHASFDGAYSFTWSCLCGVDFHDATSHSAHVAAAVVAALHPTITTVEQMLALPVGSIVKFADGSADQRGIDAKGDGEWSWSIGALEDLLSTGPATVLHVPAGSVGVESAEETR